MRRRRRLKREEVGDGAEGRLLMPRKGQRWAVWTAEADSRQPQRWGLYHRSFTTFGQQGAPSGYHKGEQHGNLCVDQTPLGTFQRMKRGGGDPKRRLFQVIVRNQAGCTRSMVPSYLFAPDTAERLMGRGCLQRLMTGSAASPRSGGQ